jgi:long-chain fatty acid transport protein
MKRFLKLPVLLVLMIAMSLGLYSNGINLNSNGSKAIAMGGAFVGLADDYSAVFWNPAGLTQMTQKNLALFVTDIIPKANYEFALLGIDTSNETKNYFSGGLGFFKPMGSNVVAGIYAYAPSGIGGTWSGSDLAVLSGMVPYEWESSLGILALSPSVGVKVNSSLSLGIALNLYYGMMSLKMPAVGQYEESIKGMAVGATFGMLFKPSSSFSIGLSCRTPYKAKLKGDADMSGAGLLGFPTTDDAEREITAPLWLAAGICVKPTSSLTLTADVQYTNWKKLDSVPVSYSDPGWIVFFESELGMDLKWKDATQIRFGMEYQVSSCFALRAGFYLDPRVGVNETANILLPEFGYKWICFGFGLKKGKIVLDVAVEYGMGEEFEVGLTEGGMPGIHNGHILVPNIALTILL